MADPFLDLPTLMVATALVMSFAGALLMLARNPGRRFDVAVIWGASMVTGAVGFLASALAQGTIAVQSGFVTTIYLAAVALSWVGARVFSGRPAKSLLPFAGPALWLLTIPVQARSPPEFNGLFIALACIIGVSYTVGIAVELRRSRDEVLRSRPIALTLLLIHAVIYLVRAGFAVANLPHNLWNRDLIGFLTIETLLHTVGMAFLMMALLKERAELRSTEQLRLLAIQDGLTGIANRRLFDERLVQEVRRAVRTADPVALLMIDVDHFKAFNDALGHQQGDNCLIAVAQRLTAATTRSSDLLARYGGEEFVLLMPMTGLEGALAVAETLRATIEDMELSFLPTSIQTPPKITISIGAAVLVPESTQKSSRQLIYLADDAMYKAKKAGRNQVCFNAAPDTERAQFPAPPC